MKDKCPRCHSEFEKKPLKKLYKEFIKSSPKRRVKSHKFIIKCPKCHTPCVPNETELPEYTSHMNTSSLFYLVSFVAAILVGVLGLIDGSCDIDPQAVALLVFLILFAIALFMDGKTTGFLSFRPYKDKIKF